VTTTQKFTEEEVNEKFKDAMVTFDSYYKYTFSFRGYKDQYIIETTFGGDSSDIYRYDVDNMPVNFEEVNNWSNVWIKDEDTNEVVYENYGW
jgi:hypothetical protein